MIFLSGSQKLVSSLGQPGGIATLDNSGKVELTQAPPSLINSFYESSEANPANIEAILTAYSVAYKGDIVYFSVLGKSYILKANPFSTFSNWTELKSIASHADTAGNGNSAGMLKMHAGATAPDGWLICEGQEVSRTTYAALFAAIGTIWGIGDGLNTFNLPDFRGIFPRGAGTTNRAAGVDAAGNYYSETLGNYKQDKMQGHSHLHNNDQTYPDFIVDGTDFQLQIFPGGSFLGFGDISDPSELNNGVPRLGNETAPASAGVNFIIKY